MNKGGERGEKDKCEDTGISRAPYFSILTLPVYLLACGSSVQML